MTIQDAEKLLKKLTAAPIKGNYAPSPHHFDSCGPIDGAATPDGRVQITIPFVDGGVPHSITADMALATAGKRGGDDKIALDGTVEQHADLIQGFRSGLEGFKVYGRVILEFWFLDAADDSLKHIRFDVG